ncbi:MAG: FG-GAP-like repeat-containing protein [Bacteroidota bacterium]
MKRYLSICVMILGLCAVSRGQAPFFVDSSFNLPVSVMGAGMDVAAADLDGDLDLDIVLAIEFGPNKLLWNDGKGKFTDGSAGIFANASNDSEDIGIADLDLNGKLDVVIVSEDNQVHEMYLNYGKNNWTNISNRLPNSIANAVVVTDLNGDRYPDLILGNAGQNLCLINDRNANFVDETATRLPTINDITQDLKLADVDGDNDLDLFVGNEDQNRLLINDGTGKFTDESTARLPQQFSLETRKAEFGDADGDGDLDLFLSNVAWQPQKNPQNRLWMNNGMGVFTDETVLRLPPDGEFTLDGIFVDLDQDQDLDLMVAHVTNAGYQALLNNGNGMYKDETLKIFGQSFKGEALGVLAADFDGDSIPDLYFCNRGQSDQLLFGQNLATSLEENISPEISWLVVTPNPAHTQLTLYNRGEKLHAGTVSLVDLAGKQVFSQQVQIERKNTRSLRLNQPAAGTYLLKWEEPGITIEKKVVLY